LKFIFQHFILYEFFLMKEYNECIAKQAPTASFIIKNKNKRERENVLKNIPSKICVTFDHIM